MLEYPFIAIEVAGAAAMFARPDTGVTPVSYPVPTYSAAKGLFEAIAWRSTVYINPFCVEVCAPIRYERYVTNYGGPFRKPGQIKNDTNYQLIATILVDVLYRIHAVVKGKERSGRRDHARELWDRFQERLKSGQTCYTPCLGWKEFVPSYFGPLRPQTKTNESVNLIIPSMLQSVWEHGHVRPRYRQAQIINGVMSYNNQKSADVK